MIGTTTRYMLAKSLLFFCLSYSVNGVAMSPLFGTDVVLFSPMQGKLTYNGQPAANAKIVRHLVWKDDKGEKETFYTNSNGEFNLPIRREKVKIPALGEFVITQELVWTSQILLDTFEPLKKRLFVFNGR